MITELSAIFIALRKYLAFFGRILFKGKIETRGNITPLKEKQNEKDFSQCKRS